MTRGQSPRRVETVVVGAGQAGIVMSSFLGDAGREHVILDRRAEVGGAWHDRWDTFRLVTPNVVTAWPKLPARGDPHGFMTRDEILGRTRELAEAAGAPLETGTDVTRLTRDNGGFRLETNRGAIAAKHVIVAAGGFHAPRIPPFAAGISRRVQQVHIRDYRNVEQLAPGGVLVVGTGQSGVQIAEELRAAGREVTLSAGRCGRVPRRYRGRDFFEWIVELDDRGLLPTPATLPNPRMRFACNPHVSGHDGGHDTNLRQFGRDGVRLVGRLTAADGELLTFAPDLTDNLAFADSFFDERLRDDIEKVIEEAGVDVPPDDREAVEFEPPLVTDLDLASAGINSVVWTSGFRLQLDWIELPIFDEFGAPRQQRGVTDVPGLTFIGFPWQHSQRSATVFGVARDAAYLAGRW